MQVFQNLRMDLARCGCTPIIGAVQGEANTRTLVVSLYDNGIAWEIPEAAVVDVAFKKPDGTQGIYSKLPDGSPATTFSGNVLTAILAPQMLTCPGKVTAAFVFHKTGEKTLATFPFTVTVTASPAAGAERSEDYYNPTISDIAAVVNEIYLDIEHFDVAVRNAEASASAAQASAEAAQAEVAGAREAAEAAVAEVAGAKASAETAVTEATAAKAAAETAGANATAAAASAEAAGTEAAEAKAAASAAGTEATEAKAAASAAAAAAREAAEAAVAEEVAGLTAADFGAAPGGFGLGTGATFIGSGVDLNDYKAAGWYHYNAPTNAPFNYAHMLVIPGNDTDLNCHQYVFGRSKPQIMAVRQLCEGTWQPWEYINPPMNVGTEYRTTERWNGKAVYTKLVDCGALPNATQKAVGAGLSGTVEKMLRISGTRDDGEILPYYYNGNTVTLYSSRDNIYIKSSYDASARSATVQIWYTKK